jgi:hypothetical protein
MLYLRNTVSEGEDIRAVDVLLLGLFWGLTLFREDSASPVD